MTLDPSRLSTIALTGECSAEEAGELASMVLRMLQPRARTGDRATSHTAADSVLRMTDKRQAVLRCFQVYGPQTDEGLVSNYTVWVPCSGHPEQSESGLRTRRAELVRMGLLRDSGRTATLASGRQGTVWEVVA